MVVDERGWENLAPEQMQPMIDEMERYNQTLRDGGAWVSGEGYGFSWDAKTVRVDNGSRSVQEGPAIKSPVQVGGHWIIEAGSIDDAVDWAKKVPMQNGSIEVRGLVSDDYKPAD
jgi:hypothetical protein